MRLEPFQGPLDSFTLGDLRARHISETPLAVLDLLEPAFWSWPLPLAPDGPWKDVLEGYQQGRCAICEDDRYELLYDHDHGTGLIRAQLCGHCNAREGSLKHGQRLLFRRYRVQPPMERLGLSIQYKPAARVPKPERVLAAAVRHTAWLFENGHMDRAEFDDRILSLLTAEAA
jgi:hypothetical protein